MMHGFTKANTYARQANGCIHCKRKKKYSEKYDAYYCKKCDWWAEPICNDKNCVYCAKRPRYPSEAKVL